MTKAVPLSQEQKTKTVIEQLKGEHWIAPALALHNKAREELPADQKKFLVPRSALYFENLLAEATGGLFGAFVEGELVGMNAMLVIENWKIAKDMHYITYPDKTNAARALCGCDSVGVNQSLCVLKEHKGNGIGPQLIAATIKHAMDQCCGQIFTQVAKDNFCAASNFFRQSFELFGAWEGKDHDRFFMRHVAESGGEKIIDGYKLLKGRIYPKAAPRYHATAFLKHTTMNGRRVRYNPAKSRGPYMHLDIVA